MNQRIVSFLLPVLLLLTGSACAAAKESAVDSAASLTVSNTLEESSPVESHAVTTSKGGTFADVLYRRGVLPGERPDVWQRGG